MDTCDKSTVADKPDLTPEADSQTELEKMEVMLTNMNLFNLLHDDGDMTATTCRSVTRNDLWKVIKFAYSALWKDTVDPPPSTVANRLPRQYLLMNGYKP